MKTRYSLLIVMAISFLVASCGGDNLTPQKITKLYNDKAAELCLDKVYTTIDTGYYELNNWQKRYELQQLAHAGVIDYEVERFAWFNKCTDIRNTVVKVIHYYCLDSGDESGKKKVYGKGEVISYEYEEHFMVKVKIKSKYQSMVVDALPTPAGDKDLAYPEFIPTDEDLLDNNEDWPELVAPTIPAPPIENQYIKCRQKKEPVKVTKKETPKKPAAKPARKPRCVAVDAATKQRYDAAKKMEVRGSANILAYEVHAVVARYIQIFEKEDKTQGARCEVIAKTTNVTPQGHIIMSAINDIPVKLNVTLTYYLDKGWVIDAAEKNVKKQVVDKRGRKTTVNCVESEFPRPEVDLSHVIIDLSKVFIETFE